MASVERIKLVQVIADSAVGGGPKHVLGILRHLEYNKFQPFLLCPSGYLMQEAKKIKGLEVISYSPKSKFDLVQTLKLKRSMQMIQSAGNPFAPMIVHAHGPRASFMVRIAALNNIKLFFTEHLYSREYHLTNRLNGFIQKKLIGWIYKRADLVIAVSKSVKDHLIESGLVDQARVVVIPNGIELDNIISQKVIKTANKAPIIGTIGNINKQKGQIFLIEALVELKKKYPLITLEILGEGPEKVVLQERVEELHLLHHVSFLGRKADVIKYLRHWDVFVLPSISETFGIAVLEAMANSVPVVASRVGGVPDIITNKENGILITPGDAGSIVRAVSEVLDHPAVAARIKRGANERVKDFDWNRVVKRLETIYLSYVIE